MNSYLTGAAIAIGIIIGLLIWLAGHVLPDFGAILGG